MARIGNEFFSVDNNLVAKWQKYKSRSSKSFHRPPLYRPSNQSNYAIVSRHACKLQDICFHLHSDAPRFKTAVQCGILYIKNLYDVDCRCSRCSRLPLFPSFPPIFFRSFDRSIRLFSPVSSSMYDSSS